MGGPVLVTINFIYEPVSSEGTRITQRNEGEPGGFFGLVGPVLERALRRQMRTTLENLNDLLEARGQPQRQVNVSLLLGQTDSQSAGSP